MCIIMHSLFETTGGWEVRIKPSPGRFSNQSRRPLTLVARLIQSGRNGQPIAKTGNSQRRTGVTSTPSSLVLAYAAIENSMFNCLNRSRYRWSHPKRLTSMTKSSQSWLVVSIGDVSKDR